MGSHCNYETTKSLYQRVAVVPNRVENEYFSHSL